MLDPTNVQQHDQQQQDSQAVYDVYFVKRPQAQQQPPIVNAPSHPQRHIKRLLTPSILVPSFILLVNLAIIAGAIFSYVLPILTNKAVVTLVPQEATLSTDATMSIQTRFLSSLTRSQSTTVPATQHIHQNAAAATGELTFYNALQQPQFIAAGTLITASSGVNIVTTQDVSVPAGDGITNGHATVPAQATNPGEAGNIPAYAINGTCCREYMLAKNLYSFTGGQSARDYTVVSQQDITLPVARMQKSLTSSIQTQYQRALQRAEILVQPMPCTPSVTTNHQVGDEATSVSIQLTLSCTGFAYTQDTLQQQATSVLNQFAGKKLGAGYQPIDTLRTEIKHITVSHMQVVFRTHLTGMYAYTLNVGKIKQEIAGKPRTKALYLLTHHKGIQHVFIHSSLDTLPIDQSNIVISLVLLPSYS